MPSPPMSTRRRATALLQAYIPDNSSDSSIGHPRQIRSSAAAAQADDSTKISRAMGRLADAPIWIDDTPALTLLEMRSKARRLRIDSNIGLIVVDYLQLMRSPAYAKDRVQFGKPIGKYQAVSHALVDMRMRIDAARHLSYHAAELLKHRVPCRAEASMAKLAASEALVHATN